MTREDVERLRAYQDRLLHLRTHDGEALTVRLLMMQDEYQDFICDLISSDQEHRYPSRTACYVIRYEDVASFDLIEETS